jgi:hypothetical protein
LPEPILARKGRTRIRDLGSCNGDVLCGIPYRGSGALASPVPTNRLLSSLAGELPSLNRAAQEAPLPINNFLRVSLPALNCKPRTQILLGNSENRLPSLLANLSIACSPRHRNSVASGCNSPRLATAGQECKRNRVRTSDQAVEMGARIDGNVNADGAFHEFAAFIAPLADARSRPGL